MFFINSEKLRKLNKSFSFLLRGIPMKFQVKTRRIGDDVRITVQTPHGRRWSTAHTHDFTLRPDRPYLQQYKAELELAMVDSGVMKVDNVG